MESGIQVPSFLCTCTQWVPSPNCCVLLQRQETQYVLFLWQLKDLLRKHKPPPVAETIKLSLHFPGWVVGPCPRQHPPSSPSGGPLFASTTTTSRAATEDSVSPWEEGYDFQFVYSCSAGLPAGSYQHFIEVGRRFLIDASTYRAKAKQLLLTWGLRRS